MNAEECARIVSLVRTYWPAQRFDGDPQNVVAAWGHVIADVTFGEAHEAVILLARRGAQWCSPGDVRQVVAEQRHALAPDVDELLADVRAVAAHDGIGRRQLHPAAQRAYEAVGGALSIRRMDTVGLLQLRKVIAEQASRHDAQVLTGRMPAPAPAHVPITQGIQQATRELTAREEPTADLTPPELYSERAEALRAFVQGGEDS